MENQNSLAYRQQAKQLRVAAKYDLEKLLLVYFAPQHRIYPSLQLQLQFVQNLNFLSHQLTRKNFSKIQRYQPQAQLSIPRLFQIGAKVTTGM